jgi:hypothetical protein
VSDVLSLHAAHRLLPVVVVDRLDRALLSGRDLATAVELGAAHGALAMTTPGDTSMATLAEVEALVRGAGARVQR